MDSEAKRNGDEPKEVFLVATGVVCALAPRPRHGFLYITEYRYNRVPPGTRYASQSTVVLPGIYRAVYGYRVATWYQVQ